MMKTFHFFKHRSSLAKIVNDHALRETPVPNTVVIEIGIEGVIVVHALVNVVAGLDHAIVAAGHDHVTAEGHHEIVIEKVIEGDHVGLSRANTHRISHLTLPCIRMTHRSPRRCQIYPHMTRTMKTRLPNYRIKFLSSKMSSV